MVGAGTLGTEADASLQVSVPKLALATGACAWWVGGENQKTRLAAAEPPDNDAELLHRRSQWPGSGAGMLDGLDQLPAGREVLEKAPSLSMLGVAGDDSALRDKLREHFHDLSTDAVGVLANVRDGGLKKDLNLLLERDTLPEEFGSYHLARPSGTIEAIRPNLGSVPKAFFDPYKPNFSSWYKLHQYYSLYRGGDGPGDETADDCDPVPYHRGLWGKGTPNVNFHWHRGNFDQFGYTRTPMMARLMMVLSTHRVRTSNSTRRFDYKLGINPVVTIWNPYNATLHTGPLAVRFFPRNIEYKAYKDGVLLFDWKEATLGGKDSTNRQLDVLLREAPNSEQAIVLKPGQTRIYSALSGSGTDANQQCASSDRHPGRSRPGGGNWCSCSKTPATAWSGSGISSMCGSPLRPRNRRYQALPASQRYRRVFS